ncbi:MAG: hypothetical protein M3116_03855, partial [Actinomycetota bacterium]|nr:hypothetical protein [Actinomycetota bacterium]
MFWRGARGAAAVVAVVVLAGCASGDRVPTPSTELPTAAALFASDEDATIAAEKAYRDYVAMADRISIDGGADPERLEEFATESVLQSDY